MKTKFMQWNPDDPVQVAAAEADFDKWTAEGYEFVSDDHTRVEAFDPSYGRLIGELDPVMKTPEPPDPPIMTGTDAEPGPAWETPPDGDPTDGGAR